MYLWFNYIKNRGVLHSKPRKKNHNRYMLNSIWSLHSILNITNFIHLRLPYNIFSTYYMLPYKFYLQY